MARKPRRSFTVEQKVAILKRHLIDKVPVSEVCAEADIQPSVFYYWQKQLFANADRALEASAAGRERRELHRKVEQLEAKLARKDEVIAQISEEYVKAKKALGEP